MGETPNLHAWLFESASVALCVVDRDGQILLMNPALERLLGWGPADRSGQPLARCLQQAIVDPAQALCWTVALSEALALGKTTYLSLPTDFRTAGDAGHLESLTGVVMPIQHGDTGQPGGMIAFHSHALAENMEAMRARFFAAASHELGLPISNISAAADLLTKHLDAGNLRQWKLIQIIQAEAARLQRLMVQFFSTSPVSKTTPLASKNVVTLHPLIQRIVEIFRLQETGHQIIVQAPQALPLVWGDTDGIQEVLSNLVNNALRYSPAGTSIVLSAEARENDILVRVTDQGHGISKEDESMLFEPRWRAGRSEQNAEGQGLGLSIARTLIQGLGGELWYERGGEGGSCFCFTLPLV